MDAVADQFSRGVESRTNVSFGNIVRYKLLPSMSKFDTLGFSKNLHLALIGRNSSAQDLSDPQLAL